MKSTLSRRPGSRLLRPRQVYGPGNPIPVGRTKFYEHYVYHPGGEEFVPGTKIRRLKLANITNRARAAFEDEVLEIVEALREERDRQAEMPTTTSPHPPARAKPPI
jgi:hypothetical protein